MNANQINGVENMRDRPDVKPTPQPKKSDMANQIEGVEKITDRPDAGNYNR